MKIGIIGAGYVGLIQGVGIASSTEHEVVVYDVNEQTIEQLDPIVDRQQFILPFYEDGLAEYLTIAKRNHAISFKHVDPSRLIYDGLKELDVVFVCVPTEANPHDGSANISIARSVCQALTAQDYRGLVVIKSTVPPMTCRNLAEEYPLLIVSNPEFLREGQAINDFNNPERTVIGLLSDIIDIDDELREEYLRAVNNLYTIYADMGIVEERIFMMDTTSAEMSKYASNAFLALKLTYINELTALCKTMEASIEDVTKVMGADHRIGHHFLKPGPGFGGSCFPKDVLALIRSARDVNCSLPIVEQLQHSNDEYKIALCNRIAQTLQEGDKISVLGVAFKAETDDTRGSLADTLFPMLRAKFKDLDIAVHDPRAMTDRNYRKYSKYDVEWNNDIYKVAEDSSVIVILTEWEEYKKINWAAISPRMQAIVVFDYRNIIEDDISQHGFFVEKLG